MELEILRIQLDSINEEIIALLAKRRTLTRQIARLKKRKKLPLYDENREKLQCNRVREIAKVHALDPNVIEVLFKIYVTYCREEMAKDML